MDKDNINIFNTPNELAICFAEILSNKFDDLLSKKEIINIALSGGNTPIELFKILASDYRNKIKWNSINFYWVDERCVSPDDAESNYGNAVKYLFSIIDISENNIHMINGDTSPTNEAAKYSDEVMQNVPKINALPSFDIILLGIGDDGHTASIFPNQMELLYSEKLYDISFHPLTLQKRITMTGKVINNAKNIYFLVTGVSKSDVIGKILNSSIESVKYPAANIKPTEGKLIWYLDRDTAKNINI